MAAIEAVLSGIRLTIIVTVGAFLIGSTFGVPLVLARRSAVAPVRLAAAALIDMVRGLPTLVWLFLIFFGIGNQLIKIGSLEAALAGLGMIAATYMAEIYRGGLAAVPIGQWDAADALGLSRVYVLGAIIGPQAIRAALPSVASYAIGLLKDSSIASTIGVAEIVFQANLYAEYTKHVRAVYLVAGAAYIVLSLPLAFASRHVDMRLRARLEA